MCWLASVVREELGEVLKGTILGFGGAFEDSELLGRGVDVVEAATGTGQGQNVGNGRAGKENMGNKLRCKVLEQHSGGLELGTLGNRRLLLFFISFSMVFLMIFCDVY